MQLKFFICYYCAIVIVVTVFICTCFLFCVANLLFSYSATQPQVCNKTLCVCGCVLFTLALFVLDVNLLVSSAQTLQKQTPDDKSLVIEFSIKVRE